MFEGRTTQELMKLAEHPEQFNYEEITALARQLEVHGDAHHEHAEELTRFIAEKRARETEGKDK